MMRWGDICIQNSMGEHIWAMPDEGVRKARRFGLQVPGPGWNEWQAEPSSFCLQSLSFQSVSACHA